MTHTSGPWKAKIRFGISFVDLPDDTPPIEIRGKNRIENARLIAAAPELLAACKAMVTALDGLPIGREELDAQALGEQAISKVEG